MLQRLGGKVFKGWHIIFWFWDQERERESDWWEGWGERGRRDDLREGEWHIIRAGKAGRGVRGDPSDAWHQLECALMSCIAATLCCTIRPDCKVASSVCKTVEHRRMCAESDDLMSQSRYLYCIVQLYDYSKAWTFMSSHRSELRGKMRWVNKL